MSLCLSDIALAWQAPKFTRGSTTLRGLRHPTGAMSHEIHYDNKLYNLIMHMVEPLPDKRYDAEQCIKYMNLIDN